MKFAFAWTCFLIVLISCPFPSSAVVSVNPEWRDVCPDPEIRYCLNLRTQAYDLSDPEDKSLGMIVGVIWLESGSVINEATGQRSEQDGHYYLIDGGSAEAILRPCAQVRAV